jgi:hypothetical protein
VRIRGLVFAGIESDAPVELVAFLSDVLGLDGTEEDGVSWFELEGGSTLAVVPRERLQRPSDVVLGLLVDDLDEATSELEAGGVTFEAPGENEQLRWRAFRAPGGHFLELLERR